MRDSTENDDEADLLQRARRGDDGAFARLCERHRLRVWRVAAGVAASPADADDLAQEAILRAWHAVRGFRGDASFAAWLCRIALNAAHDFQRSAWRRRVLLRADRPAAIGEHTGEDGEPEPAAPCSGDCGGGVCGGAPHEQAARRETRLRVRAAVAALGAKERVPIYLIYFEEFTLAEVARLERVPESTVRSRVKVGLKRLGQSLGDLVEASEDSTLAQETKTGSASTETDWSECRA